MWLFLTWQILEVTDSLFCRIHLVMHGGKSTLCIGWHTIRSLTPLRPLTTSPWVRNSEKTVLAMAQRHCTLHIHRNVPEVLSVLAVASKNNSEQCWCSVLANKYGFSSILCHTWNIFYIPYISNWGFDLFIYFCIYYCINEICETVPFGVTDQLKGNLSRVQRKV